MLCCSREQNRQGSLQWGSYSNEGDRWGNLFILFLFLLVLLRKDFRKVYRLLGIPPMENWVLGSGSSGYYMILKESELLIDLHCMRDRLSGTPQWSILWYSCLYVTPSSWVCLESVTRWQSVTSMITLCYINLCLANRLALKTLPAGLIR